MVHLLHSIKYTVDVPFANMTVANMPQLGQNHAHNPGQQAMQVLQQQNQAASNSNNLEQGSNSQHSANDKQLPKKLSSMSDKLKKPFKKRHSNVPGRPTNRVNKYLSQAIEARSVDHEKSTHVNLITLCFRDKFKERLYHEERDHGFGASLACTMAILILLAIVQVAVLPRTLILVVLFVASFVWIATIIILVLGARLECIKFQASGHFLARLAMMIFTVVIVYAVAQVNVVRIAICLSLLSSGMVHFY